MRKGFTLIELLIVIGILAVLATIVVLVLNPAQLLAQARDAQRISDLSSIKSAVALYLTAVDSPTLTAGPFSTFITTTPTCFSLTGTCTNRLAADTFKVDGNGWVGVNLSAIPASSGGTPLSSLPKDPTDDATRHYAYKGDDTAKTFELNAFLESQKFSPNMGTDGGNSVTAYEVGTDPALDL